MITIVNMEVIDAIILSSLVQQSLDSDLQLLKNSKPSAHSAYLLVIQAAKNAAQLDCLKRRKEKDVKQFEVNIHSSDEFFTEYVLTYDGESEIRRYLNQQIQKNSHNLKAHYVTKVALMNHDQYA